MDESAPNNPPCPSRADLEATSAFAPDDSTSELVRVLDRYMDDLRAGRNPDRDKLLAEHPQLAGQLEACLAGIDFIHHTAAPAETPAQLGDFRIFREIGQGGMGVVYEAEQRSLGRRVALKVLRFGAAGDKEAMQRFEQEARTVAHLHHTNIVPIFAVGCERGVHYYAMQYIEGRSLAAVAQEAVATGLRCSPADVARWGLEAADALAHAHQRGVIHRDVKPSNLLLDSDGRLWLTDFGLARRIDEVTLTITGALMGTPRYMSPEQATAVKHPIDHRTDIYSLGATLYELVTGQPVFDGTTPHALISQIIHDEPTAPRQLRTDLPRDLETIILKCLAKEPSRRYTSAAELADDLRSFNQGRAIRARRPSLMERAARWSAKQRRSALVAAATLALAVVGSLAGALGWSAYQDSLNGKLVITTGDSKLVGEILAADDDRLLVPSFSLPTQQPVVLAEGEYRLRLTAPGQLGETYRFSVERNREQKVNLALGQRELHPAIEIPKTFDLLPLADHSDLIVRTFDGVRRVDGQTGGELWNVKFAEMFPMEKTGLIWDPYRHEGWDRADYRPLLASNRADLDGDGEPELVWSGQRQATLLAVSGKSGKPLWLFHERGAAQSDNNTYEGSILGPPAMADVDGDGSTDFIASLVVRREDKPLDPSTAERLVVAISGKTGKELWRHSIEAAVWSARTARLPFDSPVLDGVPSANDPTPDDFVPYAARWFGTSSSNTTTFSPIDAIYAYPWYQRTNPWVEVPYAPQVIELAGKIQVAVVAGGTLLLLDPRTGEVADRQRLDVRPTRAPQLLTTAVGEESRLLLTRQSTWETVELIGWSIGERQASWRTTIGGARWGFGNEEPAPEWPLVVDLDGNGTHEIILPTGGFIGSEHAHTRQARRWGGLTIVEGDSGAVRSGWPQKIIRSEPNFFPALFPLDAFAAGPDIDGDGVRDVFIAASVRTWSGEEDDRTHFTALQVDARSGVDGRVLWLRRIRLAGIDASAARFVPLAWGPLTADGHPQLIVNYVPSYDPQRRDTLFIFSSGTGQLLHEGADLRDPQVADLDGDGLLDIACLQPQQSHRDSQGMLRTFRGTCPDVWRRLGEFHTAIDLDGDHLIDLQSNKYRGETVSSRNGKFLWRTAGPARYDQRRKFFDSPLGDLDGDGVGDALVFQRRSGFSGARVDSRDRLSPLEAISGRTGTTLWWTPLPVYVSVFGDTSIHDLDGDGRGEVLLIVAGDIDVERPANSIYSDHEWRLWLAVFSGRDGALRWKQPLGSANQWGRQWPEENNGLIPAVADLDGDGVHDVVIGANTDGTETGAELRAFSGRDGQPLWQRAVSSRQTRQHLMREFPRPVIGDLDGDGRAEVVVLDTAIDPAAAKDSDEAHRFHDEVIALDGRSGEQRWRWRSEYQALPAGLTWTAGHERFKPEPLLVNLSGDGKLAVCVWNSREATIALVGADGRTRDTRKVDNNFARLRVWSADLDGDGKDELVFPDRDDAVVTQAGLQNELWRRKSAGEINAVRRAAEGKLEVAAETAHFARGAARGNYWLTGLDGATGQPRWLCDYPNPRSRRAYVDIPTLAAPEETAPRVVFYDQDVVSVVRQALPTVDGARFQTTGLSKAAVQPPDHDSRLLLPLPWERIAGSPSEIRTIYLFLIAGLTLFAAIATYLAFQYGTKGVVTLLLGVLVLALVVAAVQLLNNGPLADDERYSWAGWYKMLILAPAVTGMLLVQMALVYMIWEWLVRLWLWGPGRLWLPGMRKLGALYRRFARR